MPITNVPSNNTGPGGGGRSVFRPPWVKDGTNTAPTTWRRPSTVDPKSKTETPAEPAKPESSKVETKSSKTAAAPAVVSKDVPKVDVKPKSPATTPAPTTEPSTNKSPGLKKSTVKTQLSMAKNPTENGQPVQPPPPQTEMKAKLQSREIKVPIMTEHKKPAPPPLKRFDSKEKEIKIVVEQKEEPPKPSIKILEPSEKAKMPLKRDIPPKEPPPKDSKFVRPVLRKVPKVDECFKEIEKTKAPTVVLKRAETIKKEIERAPKIEVNLSRTNIHKKEPERVILKKSDPVKAPFGKKSHQQLQDDEEEEEEEDEEEVEEEETEEETDSEEESTEEDTEKSVTEKKPPTIGAPPPPPPPPPMMNGPPPPPPPQKPNVPIDLQKKPITKKHKEFIEKLKTRPRRRPDWSEMMKEVESGRKLKHVQCNDRSNPILTSKSMTKVKGQYVFETEKNNKLNVLLQEIQGGVRLRPTVTNDRSKPVLDGLRKFRRQMTIEEQLLKSESRAQLNIAPDKIETPEAESPDEMDDIDKLRDDLQSTKQLLAIELRSREAQDRENKRLTARVQILEAELAREKWVIPISSQPEPAKPSAPVDEQLLTNLKKEADEAQSTSKVLEKKFHDTAEQLDKSKIQVEQQKRQIAELEKKLSQALQGIGIMPDNGRRGSEAQNDRGSSPELEPEISEGEEEEDEEKKAERLARRLARDVRILRIKLNRYKEKQKIARREREMLRDIMKKNHVILKEEKKKFKKLQREVDKMAAMMKDVDDEDGEEKEETEKEPEEEAEPEESAESEESSEEESEESGNETASESEEEDAPNDKKKTNLEPRVKRHEGRLTALKKGNYLLQANVDRLQDEITRTKEASVTMQYDLDSVLSELG